MTDAPVLALDDRATNGHLIADCARLGYLHEDAYTLDPTYGEHGGFWKVWRPRDLVACDIEAEFSPIGYSVDFTALPWPDGTFDAITFDPPYKLNGTPTEKVDRRFGVGGKYVSKAGRQQLILDGLTECARVLRPLGFLLVKVMDQVNGGKVSWQTDIVTRHAETLGLVKIDVLLFRSYRPQPEGRSQQHARRNYSTLLVFQGPR